VLFLIDATVRDCNVYNRYKITGSSTLIKAFGKACASSRDFSVDALLADQCFFYEGAHIEELIEAIANGSVNKDSVHAMETRHAGKPVLSREAQRERLVSALRKV
jgi:hypothetical protein